MTLIESVRNYMMTCPVIDKKSKVNIDFLPELSVSHSISPAPSGFGGIVEETIGGNVIKEYLFAFMTRFPYEEHVLTHFENSGFLEEIVRWIEVNNKNKVFPILQPEYTPLSIEVVQTPFLFFSDNGDTAEYMVTLRLTYEIEGEI